MQTQVRILGVVRMAMGGFLALATLGILFATWSMVSTVRTMDRLGSTPSGLDPSSLLFYGAIASFLLFFALAGIVTGIGLFTFQSWARPIGLVFSVLDLLMLPIGTVAGVYGLWVLLAKDTERLFARPPSAAAAPV